MIPLLMSLLLLLRQEPTPAIDARQVATLLERMQEARRTLTFAPAQAELAAVVAATTEEALARVLAGHSADFLAEATLFGQLIARIADAAQQGQPLPWPDDELDMGLVVSGADADGVTLTRDGVVAKKAWASFPPKLTFTFLAALPLAPAERLELARFAFWRDLDGAAIEQLRAALLADPSLKERSDPLLARQRSEEVPHGGYEWHRGQFLPAAEVNRRRALEALAQQLEHTLDAEAPVRLAQVIGAPAGAIDDFALRLVAATHRIVVELAQLYEAPRDWIQSYRISNNLRHQRLAQLDAWQPVAKAALELIGKYDKPQQPDVDEFRELLAEKAKLYASLRKSDEITFARLDPRAAETLLLRLERLEPALAALLDYRRAWHGEVADPFPAVSPQGAKVHVLPGRNGAGLEEVLYALLHAKAGRTLPFLQRAEELLRAELTPWERAVLRDFHWDALDEYDARALTSADLEEQANLTVLNEYRRTLLLAPFELDERMVIAARGHSQEMKDIGYFGHDSPTEKLRTPTDRVRVAGYGGGAGENCYAGGGGGRGAFEAWYHSPGHHRGMVSGGPHFGCGTDTTHALWTQNFGGTDWGWRRWFPTLTQDESDAVETALTKLARTKHDTCRDELDALLELGGRALPAMSRALTAARVNVSSDQRGFATRLARATAVAAVAEGIPQASDLAIETLLTLLDDSSGVVRGEANLALQHVTAKSFGFGASLEPPARAAAVKRWRDWWKAAREEFTPQIETNVEEIEAFDVASPLAGGKKRQSPDAPIKVFSPEERFALARRLGGSRQTEAAVGRALDWLVRHQSVNGSWGAKQFEACCRGEKCAGTGAFDFDVGLTGLTLLALIHGGSTIEIGPHQGAVKKGLDFLVARMQEHGKFTTTSGWYMYQHALATQALCEGYGTSGDPFLKVAAQRAVDFLIFAQHPELGGWRYEARSDADTSVTGWVVLALVAAHDARLKVAGFRGAREWIERVTEPSYYRVGYQSPLDAATQEPRLTAVGIVCRQALGTRANHPAIMVGKEWCLRQLPRVEHTDLYFAYYATLGLFQIGGESWQRWNDALVPALLQRIHPNDAGCLRGSFDSQGVFQEYGGRVYATAMCALMLEVYYRYEKFPEVRGLSITGSLESITAPLIAKLGSGGSDIERAVAMRRLEEELGTSAQAPLLQLLRTSSDLAAKQDAAEVLAHVANSAGLTDLLGLLDEPDGTVQERLFRAVGRAADPNCIPDLARRLADERPHVRRFAARTLGQLGSTAALAPLIARQTVEPDGGIKDEITQAIRTLSNRGALDLLLDEAGFLATEAARRADVREGLRLLENHPLLTRIVAAKAGEPECYAAAIAALRDHGRRALVPLLLVALALQDAEARGWADQLLIALAGRNQGFDANAIERVRKEAVTRWRAWWKSAQELLAPSETERPAR
ncbi:MAG: hypothetical protein EXS13_12040 [Planctomycetes bacterium]|nr:hypothetical protein [Planctomycetota bacterium]